MVRRPPAPAPQATTTHAVLGMLALRPWTPYELTHQVRRSLRYCWPVSERALYAEPERLVAAGLATVEEEVAGRRTRRTYSITDAGRDALRTWLGTAPAEPRFQFEAMLRLLFADIGTREDLLASIASFRAAMVEMMRDGVEQVAPYLDGEGPFPERAHIVALFGALFGALAETVIAWADAAAAEVDGWDTTAGLGLTAESRRHLEELVQAAAALGEPSTA